jgi:hypothetical protein
MGTFNAQELANTAWAFAAAGVRAPGLFAALAAPAEQRISTFNAQNHANTAWAFATAGVRAPGLFSALAVHSEQRMGTFNAQELANTAWAFAAAGVRAPGLFAALAVHSEQRAPELDSANTKELDSWKLASSQPPPPSVAPRRPAADGWRGPRAVGADCSLLVALGGGSWSMANGAGGGAGAGEFGGARLDTDVDRCSAQPGGAVAELVGLLLVVTNGHGVVVLLLPVLCSSIGDHATSDLCAQMPHGRGKCRAEVAARSSGVAGVNPDLRCASASESAVGSATCNTARVTCARKRPAHTLTEST